MSSLIALLQILFAMILLSVEYVARTVVKILLSIFPQRLLLKSYPILLFLNPTRGYDIDCNRSSKELIESKNYVCEEHECETSDGWILGLQRIPCTKDEMSNNKNNNSRKKPVVLIMHGFLQSSEAWLVHKNPHHGLPYILVDNGFDVWMGNNRGNSYSHKHRKYTPDKNKYWDFSIDDFIHYDIPTMINYILKVTGNSALSYIGFSQGSAQGFGAFSSDPELGKKINLFVALAPTTKVRGFNHRFVNTIINVRPEVCYMIFGRKAFLSSALFWRKVLSTSLYTWVMIKANYYLFGWSGANIDETDSFYNHIYSYTSVKVVTHWFQIQQSGKFQMYDDAQHNRDSNYRPYHSPIYHLSRINCPVALFYGGSDSLPNFESLFDELQPIFSHEVSSYEHLCFIWARDAHEKIFPQILNLLKTHEPMIQEKIE